MRQWVASHDTAVFLVLTYGISWPLWIVSGALSRAPIRAPDLSWLVAQIGVFAPAFAGMAVGACVEPAGVRRALRLLGFVYAPAAALGLWIATRRFASFMEIDAASSWGVNLLAVWLLVCFGAGRNRLVPWTEASAGWAKTILWSLSCLLGLPALFLIAWAVTGGTVGGSSNLPAMPVRDLTISGALAAFTMNLAFGGSLGEEPGWRGAWLPRLLRNHNPVAASVIISFWWALWHAPIDLAQGFGLAGMGGLAIRQIWTLPVTIIFTWVTLRASGSLLPPLILHTTLNAIPDFVLSQPAHYERALGTLVLLLIVIVVIAAFADPRLRGARRKD